MQTEKSEPVEAGPGSPRAPEDPFYTAFQLCPFIMTIHSFPGLKILDVNRAYERRTGLTRAEVVGRTPMEVGLFTDPASFRQIVLRLRKYKRISNFEVLFRNKAGEAFTALASSEVVDSTDGQRVLSFLEDTSLRKRAEDAARECESKFKKVFQEAGVGMVICDPDGHFIAANQEFCQMLGYSEEELLDKNIRSLIYLDDVRRSEESLKQAVEEGRKFYRLEFRYLHKNGHVLWTENTASMTRNHDGTVQYFVAQIVDITARKSAEKTAARLSGLLIEAQEDERRRIARELHDDFGQRLAVIIMDLDKLTRDFDSLDQRGTSIQSLSSRAKDLATDLQNLSHRLHSSKLDYIGLIAAIQGLCSEYESQGFEVSFAHSNVREDLPWKKAICLFRIVQEALSNAVKYSGVKKFEVQLNGFPSEISLSIHDSGAGFDVEKAKYKGSLGLVSMEERANLLGGTFSIVSGPTSGTLISVRIPLVEQALAAPRDEVI